MAVCLDFSGFHHRHELSWICIEIRKTTIAAEADFCALVVDHEGFAHRSQFLAGHHADLQWIGGFCAGRFGQLGVRIGR